MAQLSPRHAERFVRTFRAGGAGSLLDDLEYRGFKFTDLVENYPESVKKSVTRILSKDAGRRETLVRLKASPAYIAKWDKNHSDEWWCLLLECLGDCHENATDVQRAIREDVRGHIEAELQRNGFKYI